MKHENNAANLWPELNWADWNLTADTLHMWTQIVGKTRLALSPLQAHWWNVPLYVSARGLSTSAMPWGAEMLEIEFDFVSHLLRFRLSDGASLSTPLRAQTVADFYRDYQRSLAAIGVSVRIHPVPVELKNPIPFAEDTVHRAYDPESANRFWRILVRSDQIFQQFSSRFIGKISPVHFFWGSFDLAVTRFSGRPAPAREGADAITREAYSHEVISAGFWPGNGGFGDAAFYCYAAPAPADLDKAAIEPRGAGYNTALGEFILKYDELRAEPSPDEALLQFLQSSYEAAANLARWDRSAWGSPGFGQIRTIAGTGTAAFLGDGGPATAASFHQPGGVAVDGSGNVFIADSLNRRIRRVDASTGIITTVAGNGNSGYSGDGGPAISASMSAPVAIALDSAGNIFIADNTDQRIRRVDAVSGLITTYAGNGVMGYSGDFGPATLASINDPLGVAVDFTGNLFIADSSGRIRRVDAQTGQITTSAGNGSASTAGDGGPATTAGIGLPAAVAVDSAGDLFIAAGLGSVRRVDAITGIISTVVAAGTIYDSPGYSVGIAVDSAGNIFISYYQNGDGFTFSVVGRFDASTQLLSIFAGQQFVSGSAGDGGPATSASLWDPQAIAVDPAGNLYIADALNERIRFVDNNTPAATLAPSAATVTAEAGTGTLAITILPTGDNWTASNNAAWLNLTNSSGSGSGTIAYTYTANATGAARTATISAYGSNATVTQSAAVAPISQTITFGALNNQTLAMASVTISAAASSGLAITFTSNSAAVCTVSGSTVTLVAVGACSITASQNGDNNYAAAMPVTRTFMVTVAPQTTLSPVSATVPANAGAGTFSLSQTPASAWTASSNASWLTLAASSGTGSETIGYSYIANSSTAPRTGVISVLGQTFTVTQAGEASSGTSTLTASPATLTFNAAPGGAAISRTFAVTSSTGPAAYTAAIVLTSNRGLGWLSVSHTSGSTGTQGTLTVTASPGSMTPGTYTGTINVASGSSVAAVNVTLNVTGQLTASPAALNFTYAAGDPNEPPPVSVSVFSNPTGAAYSITAASDLNWLSAAGTGGTAPTAFPVSVNVNSLARGTYAGSITISSPTSGSVSVPVTLTIKAATPHLVISPASRNLTATQGGAPITGQITVSNSGGGTLQFAVQAASDAGNWLSLTGGATGSATATSPAAVAFSANPGSVSSGLHTGTIMVTDSMSGAQSMTTLLLAVSPAAQSICLSQTGMSFSTSAGGIGPPAQTFTVLNAGSGAMSWSAGVQVVANPLSAANWLAATPRNGGSVSVSVNPAGLPAGVYYGSVNIVATGASNSPQTVSVTLNVEPPGQTGESVSVSPGGLIFTGAIGSGVMQQQIALFSPGSAPVGWTSTASAAWLSVTPASGNLVGGSNPVTVAVDLTNLTAGAQNGAIRMALADGTVFNLAVAAIATGAQAYAATGCAAGKPSSAISVFRSPLDQSVLTAGVPQNIQAQLLDGCGNPITAVGGGTAEAVVGGNALDLHDIGGGVWETTWTPSAAGAQVGLQVTASEQGVALSPASAGISVSVGIAGAGTAAQLNGAVNAAGGGVASVQIAGAGSYVAIYGTGLSAPGAVTATSAPFPTSLNGAQVFLGGVALPLYYASPTQVNALLPSWLNSDVSYPLIVVRGSTQSVPLPVTVVSLQPGIYTENAGGTGQGAVEIAGTAMLAAPAGPNSRPAVRGQDALTVYGTGLGAVQGSNGEVPPALGAPASSTTLYRTTAVVTATLGGVSAPVLFSGLAPTLVSLYQVNIGVPAGAPAGDAVPLVIAVTDLVSGEAMQSNTVTVAVQ